MGARSSMTSPNKAGLAPMGAAAVMAILAGNPRMIRLMRSKATSGHAVPAWRKDVLSDAPMHARIP